MEVEENKSNNKNSNDSDMDIDDDNTEDKENNENLKNSKGGGTKRGRIFIRNLPFSMDENKIVEMFSKIGPISDVFLS